MYVGWVGKVYDVATVKRPVSVGLSDDEVVSLGRRLKRSQVRPKG